MPECPQCGSDLDDTEDTDDQFDWFCVYCGELWVDEDLDGDEAPVDVAMPTSDAEAAEMVEAALDGADPALLGTPHDCRLMPMEAEMLRLVAEYLRSGDGDEEMAVVE